MYRYARLLPMVVLAAATAACSDLPTDALQLEAGVTTATSADLQFLREEEKLARDVYLRLGEQWGLPIFENIASSEQVHMDRVRDLLVANEISDPVAEDVVGSFADTLLAGLFDYLTNLGMGSESEALTVGATIEDLDIHDIAAMIERTNNADVLAMYASLMCGSRNHMRSFVSQLESRGGSYEAQYLSQAELNGILSTSRERCGRP